MAEIGDFYGIGPEGGGPPFENVPETNVPTWEPYTIYPDQGSPTGWSYSVPAPAPPAAQSAPPAPEPERPFPGRGYGVGGTPPTETGVRPIPGQGGVQGQQSRGGGGKPMRRPYFPGEYPELYPGEGPPYYDPYEARARRQAERGGEFYAPPSVIESPIAEAERYFGRPLSEQEQDFVMRNGLPPTRQYRAAPSGSFGDIGDLAMAINQNRISSEQAYNIALSRGYTGDYRQFLMDKDAIIQRSGVNAGPGFNAPARYYAPAPPALRPPAPRFFRLPRRRLVF